PASRLLVNFNQTYARSTTVARKNSSIVSSRDWCEHCRLQVIGRRKSSRFNFGLLRILPVIIALDDVSVGVHQSHHWVGQSAQDAKLRSRESGPEAAYQHLSGTAIVSACNKSSDHDRVTATNKASG